MSNEIVVFHVSGSSLEGFKQRFSQYRLRIGRGAPNEIQFDQERDPLVSANHAVLYVESNRLYLKDLGSRNGVFVNGQRLEAPCIINPHDEIRLADNGPVMRAELVSPDAVTFAEVPPPKKGYVGQETLQRAIQFAVSLERGKTRRTLALSVGVLTLLLILSTVSGGYLYLHNLSEQARIREAGEQQSKEVAAAREMLELRTHDEAALQRELERYDSELRQLRGKLGDGERQIARLMVEIEQRDQAVAQIKKRQDLSEEDRRRLLAETEEKLAGLRKSLTEKEEALRRNADEGSTWADLADVYKESIFCCVPLNNDQKPFGCGTAFVIDSEGVLATNAHVAKLLMGAPKCVVVQNHTGRLFKPLRVVIHPDYKDDTFYGPDLALIMIDTGDAKIPAMPLADDDDLRKLRIGMHVGTLGYPGELLKEYFISFDPSEAYCKTAQATFKDGWIGRIMTPQLQAGTFEASWHIQHSASLTGGTSGSPIFSSSGKVVAVHYGAHGKSIEVKVSEKDRASELLPTGNIGNAVRADILRKFRQGQLKQAAAGN